MSPLYPFVTQMTNIPKLCFSASATHARLVHSDLGSKVFSQAASKSLQRHPSSRITLWPLCRKQAAQGQRLARGAVGFEPGHDVIAAAGQGSFKLRVRNFLLYPRGWIGTGWVSDAELVNPRGLRRYISQSYSRCSGASPVLTVNL